MLKYNEQMCKQSRNEMNVEHKDLYEEKALDHKISGIKNLGWWKLPITNYIEQVWITNRDDNKLVTKITSVHNVYNRR